MLPFTINNMFVFALLLGGLTDKSLGLGGVNERIAGPSSPSEQPSWLAKLKTYRADTLRSINYNGSIFQVKELFWTQSSYMQPQMHPYDRYFYDHVAHEYTVDKFLADLTSRYGGIDAMLMWPTYTNIGVDNRNQFDLVRSMPGGVQMLKKILNSLDGKGVKVLVPYNPWDQGTRYSGEDDQHAMAQLQKDIGGFGFNGDTMGSVPESFYSVGKQYGEYLALEPEGGGDPQSLNWDTMGWGYWTPYPYIPGVGRWKWLDGRHMTNICNRWAKDKTDDLQHAFFNGLGYETWENVWGTWNGITQRDGEAIRRIATILRFFGDSRSVLQSLKWEPHTTEVLQYKHTFGSRFPSDNATVWLLVNRANLNTSGTQLKPTTTPASGWKYYDCYHGVELQLQKGVLSFEIEASGYGCVVYTNEPPMDSNGMKSEFGNFLSTMKGLTTHKLAWYNNEWRPLQQQWLSHGKSANTPTQVPAGMQSVPSGWFQFNVGGNEIEGDPIPTGVDVQWPWEPHPRRYHFEMLSVNGFYMDTYPVTNSDYKEYLTLSGYVPRDSYNFLKEWPHGYNGSYPQGWDDKPVTWVSFHEATDYCKYYGKRLPEEYEWQWAAQGAELLLYPWGNTYDSSKVPVPDHGRTMRGPDNVTAHPEGKSPFGVVDMVGNVWQYTSTFQDIHTRYVITRGSSYYRPSGSLWYFPTAYPNNVHGKYFLMDDTYERSGGIGFRCVQDGENFAPPPPRNCNPFCASLSSANDNIDLTATGTLDWVKYAVDNKNTIVRKANSQKYITEYVPTPDGKQCPSYPGYTPLTSFSWTDGDVVKVGKDDNGGLGFYLNMACGMTYMINLPEDSTGKTIPVRISSWLTVGKADSILTVEIPGMGMRWNSTAISNQGEAFQTGITTAQLNIDLAGGLPKGTQVKVHFNFVKYTQSKKDNELNVNAVALSKL